MENSFYYYEDQSLINSISTSLSSFNSDNSFDLQLDNESDPLEGGLTLVAHPKGKTVRRLAAMSGGVKSLTALALFRAERIDVGDNEYVFRTVIEDGVEKPQPIKKFSLYGEEV